MTRMLRKVIAVMILALASAAPSRAQDVQVRLNWSGLLAYALDSASAPVPELENANLTRVYLLHSTQKIQARIGLRFGAAFHFDGPEADRKISYTMTWRLPAGAAKPFVDFPGQCRLGRQCYGVWTFDDASELVPGEWALEVKYKGRLLLDQRFHVTVDDESAQLVATDRRERMTFLAGDEQGRPRAPQKNRGPFLLALSFIRGALDGSPSTYPLAMVPVSQGAPFELSMDELEAKASHFAETADTAIQGLRVEPAETRIGRVGTFIQNGNWEADMAGGGFIKRPTEPGRGYFLIYADRPCRITEQREYEGSLVLTDIQVPRAGLHWVDVVTSKGKDGKPVFTSRLLKETPEMVFLTQDLN